MDGDESPRTPRLLAREKPPMPREEVEQRLEIELNELNRLLGSTSATASPVADSRALAGSRKMSLEKHISDLEERLAMLRDGREDPTLSRSPSFFMPQESIAEDEEDDGEELPGVHAAQYFDGVVPSPRVQRLHSLVVDKPRFQHMPLQELATMVADDVLEVALERLQRIGSHARDFETMQVTASPGRGRKRHTINEAKLREKEQQQGRRITGEEAPQRSPLALHASRLADDPLRRTLDGASGGNRDALVLGMGVQVKKVEQEAHKLADDDKRRTIMGAVGAPRVDVPITVHTDGAVADDAKRRTIMGAQGGAAPALAGPPGASSRVEPEPGSVTVRLKPAVAPSPVDLTRADSLPVVRTRSPSARAVGPAPSQEPPVDGIPVVVKQRSSCVVS